MNGLRLVFALMTLAIASNQSAVSSPAQDTHQKTTDSHAAGVDARGDHAMGFSHEKSVHHFLLRADGGAIEVTANDPKDKATRDEIRMHLTHVAQMFTEGNFQVPMFIHDTVPPGVAEMKSKRASILYVVESMPDGGRIQIKTTDADALKAIHHFLEFQIEDHRTGDSAAGSPVR